MLNLLVYRMRQKQKPVSDVTRADLPSDEIWQMWIAELRKYGEKKFLENYGSVVAVFPMREY